MKNNLFDELGLPTSYEDDFEDLACILTSFSDGQAYLNGDDSAGHFSVSNRVIELLHQDTFAPSKINRLIYVFNALKFYHCQKGSFKKEPMLTFTVQPEKNLLANLLKDKPHSRLHELLNVVFHADAEGLTSKQKIGLFSLVLSIETGVFSLQHQILVFETLLKSPSIHKIEGLFFIDTIVPDKSSNHEYTKRFFLAPIALSLLIRFNLINTLDTLLSTVKLTSAYLSNARLNFLNAYLSEPFDAKQVRLDLNFFGTTYLPGYLFAVAQGNQTSFSLSLSDFAKLHGIHIESHSSKDEIEFCDSPVFFNAEESASASNGESEEDSDAQLKKRIINTRYFSKRDFNYLIYYLSIHPTVSPKEFQHFQLVLSLCFYLGMRRGEALYLRACDVFSLETSSVPASVFIREYDQHTLKTVTSTRHQPVGLLPKEVCDEILSRANFHNKELLLNREFSKNQAIHFFDRLSKLMQEALGKSFVIHTCRHSYVSLGLLKSQFDVLNFSLLLSASSFLREIAEDQQNFRHSFRIKNITMQHLTNISQSAGHANVNTTLRHYCHSTDLLILSALNANRPEGYNKAVARYSGFSLRSLQRWKKCNQFYETSMAEIANGSINIKIHDTPLPALDPDIERSFSFYKSCNLTGELSTRELWEWVRLFKFFEPTSCKELVSFIHTRMVSRASFRLASRIELMQFIRLNKSNGIATYCWEVKQPLTKSNRYTVLNATLDYLYPIYLRVSYPVNEDAGNAPRRIFKLMICALANRPADMH